MNLSEWGAMDSDAAKDVLIEVCRQIKKGDMPVPSYTWIHRSAVLSPADADDAVYAGVTPRGRPFRPPSSPQSLPGVRFWDEDVRAPDTIPQGVVPDFVTNRRQNNEF